MPGARHDLGEMPLDERRGSENAHGDFGFHRVKGPPLGDLRLDPALPSSDVGRVVTGCLVRATICRIRSPPQCMFAT